MSKDMGKLFGDLRSIIDQTKTKADKASKGYLELLKDKECYKEVATIAHLIDSAKLSYQEWCEVKVYLIQSFGSWFSDSTHYGCEGWCSEIFGPKIRHTTASSHYTIIDQNISDTNIERNSQQGIMELNCYFNNWIYEAFMYDLCYMYLDLVRSVTPEIINYNDAEPLVLSRLNRILFDSEENIFEDTLRKAIDISIVSHFKSMDIIHFRHTSLGKFPHVYTLMDKCINFFVDNGLARDFPKDKIDLENGLGHISLTNVMRVIFKSFASDVNRDAVLNTQAKTTNQVYFSYSSSFVKYYGILPHLKIV